MMNDIPICERPASIKRTAMYNSYTTIIPSADGKTGWIIPKSIKKYDEEYNNEFLTKKIQLPKTYKEIADDIVKRIIFNPPATIVLWQDGTKTVVKCQNGEEFDPEKGLTMAIVKKIYGLGVFNKMMEKAEYRGNIDIEKDPTASFKGTYNLSFVDIINSMTEKVEKLNNFIKEE